VEAPVQFCEESMRCEVCPFRVFHDETARSVVGTVADKIANDTRQESNTRYSHLVKARVAMQGAGIARPDFRQMNFLADAAEAVTSQTCTSYDVNGRIIAESDR